MSGWLTFSHRRLVMIIKVNAAFSDPLTGLLWNKQNNIYSTDQLVLIRQGILYLISGLVYVMGSQELFNTILSIKQPSWSKSTLSRRDGYDITVGSGECCLTVGSVGPWPSLVVWGLWLCSLVTVYVAWQPAFLCLSQHNGEYLAAFLCLRCSQALAKPQHSG